MKNTIYVSIASYCDEELTDTVYSIIKNSSNKNKLFLYVLSQDESDNHPDLDLLFKFLSFKNYKYEKEDYSISTGVGYSRKKTQGLLAAGFEYYLQVDSHTQFVKDWDKKIIEEYEIVHNQWGKSIISTYPPGYDEGSFGENVFNFPKDLYPPVVRVVSNDTLYKFEAKYKDFIYNDTRQYVGYFCAGQAFGYAKYFLEVPYDEKIAFQGEEHTMSIRFYSKNTKIICPNKIFLFHNYNGTKRKRNWEKNPSWPLLAEESEKRIVDFYNGNLNDTFLVDMETIEKWFAKFVENINNQPLPPRLV